MDFLDWPLGPTHVIVFFAFSLLSPAFSRAPSVSSLAKAPANQFIATLT